MIRTLFAASVVASACLHPVSAMAAHITQFVGGTVSGNATTDPFGIFGPAGADLNGKPIQVYFSYETVDFNTSGGCSAPPGSTCDLHFTRIPKDSQTGNLTRQGTPQSVLIQIQINGVGRSFAPFQQGSVYFFNTPGYPGEFQVTSDGARGGPGQSASISLFYAQTTAFGSRLSPDNNPVNLSYSPSSFTFTGMVPGSTTPAAGMITFTISKFSQY